MIFGIQEKPGFWRKKGRKNVLVLSTTRPLMGITWDDGKQKPAITKFYNFIKGDMDILDQKISNYSCRSVTHRWTMAHFFFLLDTIPCNALTMYAIKHGKPLGKISTFGIGWDVTMSLVKPFIEIRPTVGLEIGLLAKLSYSWEKCWWEQWSWSLWITSVWRNKARL